MLRRIFPGLVVVVAIGCAVFWWLTIPAVVTSNSLPAYTPDTANGLTVFHAGGCSSCHAVPGQPDRLKLGGGLAMPSPFGTFHAPNISPDPADGIGRWTEAEFVSAVTEGDLARRRALFSGVSLRVLSVCEGRRRPRPLCLPEDAGAGVRQVARSRRAVSVQHPPQCRDLEMAVHGRQALRRRMPRARRRGIAAPISSNSLGHCAECHSPRNFLGGIVAAQRFAGGPNPEGEGWVPNITQKGTWRVEREGHRLFPGDRADCPTAIPPADRWCA